MRRILFSLAGHLGMTVAELSSRMGSGELAEWIALLKGVEPWGPYRSDTLAAMGFSYTVAAPGVKDPGKLISEIRLPWWKDGKKPGVKTVDPARFRSMLVAWGGKEEPRRPASGD